MAEVPDRKVLKDVPARLKVKTISSERQYRTVYDITDELFKG
jgi:hypothetical protein